MCWEGWGHRGTGGLGLGGRGRCPYRLPAPGQVGAGCDPTDPRTRVDTGKQPWTRETSCKASGSPRGWRGSPGPAPLLGCLPPGGKDKARALSSLVSTCCLLLHPESLGGSPSPLRWGWGQPALTECPLYTAGPPPSPAHILRLPMRTPRRLTGGGDASDRPSWDGARAGVTLALCCLPGACRRLLNS